jgi:hypothetical protein
MSSYQEQKKVKPEIEDVISERLPCDSKSNALEFVSYLRANKTKPRWGAANSWKVSYKNQTVCFVRIKDNSWIIQPAPYDNPNEYDELIAAENLTEFIWGNLKPCCNCGPCKPGKRVTIGGKTFENTCGYFSIQFCDPDITALAMAKKFVEFKKRLIDFKSQK